MCLEALSFHEDHDGDVIVDIPDGVHVRGAQSLSVDEIVRHFSLDRLYTCPLWMEATSMHRLAQFWWREEHGIHIEPLMGFMPADIPVEVKPVWWAEAAERMTDLDEETDE